MARSVSARKWKMRSAQIWYDGVAPASARLNGSQKKKNIKIETEFQPPIFGKCQRSNDAFWPMLISTVTTSVRTLLVSARCPQKDIKERKQVF